MHTVRLQKEKKIDTKKNPPPQQPTMDAIEFRCKSRKFRPKEVSEHKSSCPLMVSAKARSLYEHAKALSWDPRHAVLAAFIKEVYNLE
jgi:hypothetical protein